MLRTDLTRTGAPSTPSLGLCKVALCPQHPVHPQTAASYWPSQDPSHQGHIPLSSLCFGRSGACPRWRPTLWPGVGGGIGHTSYSCHGLGGQEAGKGSGTACRVRAPLSRSTWTQRAADLLTQRPLRSEHPLSPTSSTPARVSRGRPSFLSCIPCSSIQGPLEALLPGAAGAGSGPPSGPPQARVGNGKRASLPHAPDGPRVSGRQGRLDPANLRDQGSV